MIEGPVAGGGVGELTAAKVGAQVLEARRRHLQELERSGIRFGDLARPGDDDDPLPAKLRGAAPKPSDHGRFAGVSGLLEELALAGVEGGSRRRR